MKTTIQISGMHCASCKRLLESVIADVKGVKGVEVDFNTGKTSIEHDGKLDMKAIKKEVGALKLYTIKE